MNFLPERSLVREISVGDICNFRVRRLTAKDLIAVRVAPEGGDNLPHVTRLLDQKFIAMSKIGGRICRDFFPKPDEQINAFKMIRTLAMTQRLSVDNLEPRCA